MDNTFLSKNLLQIYSQGLLLLPFLTNDSRSRALLISLTVHYSKLSLFCVISYKKLPLPLIKVAIFICNYHSRRYVWWGWTANGGEWQHNFQSVDFVWTVSEPPIVRKPRDFIHCVHLGQHIDNRGGLNWMATLNN